MNSKTPKKWLQIEQHVPMDRYRRHPLLWLATYLVGLGLMVAMAVDWLWASVMTSR